MPGHSIDLERHSLVEGPECKVDVPAAPVDVFDRKLRCEKTRIFDAENLDEEFREKIFWSGTQGLTILSKITQRSQFLDT